MAFKSPCALIYWDNDKLLLNGINDITFPWFHLVLNPHSQTLWVCRCFLCIFDYKAKEGARTYDLEQLVYGSSRTTFSIHNICMVWQINGCCEGKKELKFITKFKITKNFLFIKRFSEIRSSHVDNSWWIPNNPN